MNNKKRPRAYSGVSPEFGTAPTVGFDENSDTYTQPKGFGKNEGFDYEDIRLAQIIIHLVNCENVKDFKVWSNGEYFGKFDDIIAIINWEHGETTRIAIQLKHGDTGNEERIVSNGELAQFLKKSFNDYQSAIRTNTALLKFVFMLQTNKAAEDQYDIFVKIEQNGQTHQIDLQPIQIPAPPASLLGLGDIPDAESIQFTIRNQDVVSDQLGQFLDRFYFYPHQPGVHECEQTTAQQDNFLVEMEPFYRWLQNWSKLKGEKYKLTKEWISLKIAECMISPLFRFSLELNDNCSNTGHNRALFKEAIKSFDITLIDVEKARNARMLIEEGICGSAMKKSKRDLFDYFETTPNDVRRRQQLSQLLQTHYGRAFFVSFDQEDSHQIISRAISLCKTSEGNRKFHFLADVNSSLPEDLEIFRNFDDLKKKDVKLYESIGATFKVSLEGKEPFPLSDVFDDIEVKQYLTPSHFLQMLNGEPLLIGGKVEQLPEYYIKRSLTSPTIKFDYLANIDRFNAVALICSDHDSATVSKRIPNMCDIFTSKPQDESSYSSNIYFCDKQKKHQALEILATRADLCEKNCHYFEYCASDPDQDTLKWLQSRKSTEDLLGFHSKCQSSIPEEQLANDDCCLINLVCEESGMGKSWFLRRVKANYYPDMFVIFIDPKSCAFFNQKPNADHEYEIFFFSFAANEMNALETAILKCLYFKKRVVILWDTLDPVLDDRLPNIYDAIDYFKKQQLRQWLMSTCGIRRKLERRFNVLARKFSTLGKEEKNAYINQRLGLDNPENLIPQELANAIRAKYNKDVGTKYNVRAICEEVENIIEEFDLGAT